MTTKEQLIIILSESAGDSIADYRKFTQLLDQYGKEVAEKVKSEAIAEVEKIRKDDTIRWAESVAKCSIDAIQNIQFKDIDK